MQDWFRRWYVPRAEFLRMTEYYSDEIAELRARVHELESQLKSEAAFSLDDFGFVHIVEDTPPARPSNVIPVDFRKAK
jgi:hypothetical protein